MSIFYWIVEYLASFIEVIMCNYFCGTILNKERLNEKKSVITFVSFVIAVAVIIFNRIELFTSVNTYLFLGSCILVQWILYKKHYVRAVGLVLIFMVLMSAIDFSIVNLVAMLMNIEVGYFAETQSMLRVVCILISKSILMIVVMTFYRIFHGNKSIPNRYMVLISVISAFILLSNLVMMQSGIGIDTEHVGIFSMIFFIASLGIELTLFFFCFKIADSIEKQKNTLLIEMNNEMLKKSLDDTKQALDLWRESIHDYKHKIIALTQIAEAEDVDAIKKFLRTESQLVQKKLYYIKTGNSVVDTVINTKQSVAEQNGISVMVHAHISENCKMDAMDLTIIMGNLLDNAIEACRNEMEPYIDIEMKENETFVMIDIRNKYTGSVSETLQTSKREKDFHGIGLKSVKRLVEKYHGTFLYEAVEEQFRVSIVLKKE